MTPSPTHAPAIPAAGLPIAERLEGGLVGLLLGDAVGVPYEFKRPAELPPLAMINLNPPSGFARTYPTIRPGTWSDDGAQALVLLDHLLDRDSLDMELLAEGLLRWYRDGFMAIDGRVFDVGNQTARALDRFASGMPATRAAGDDEASNGNGALMRVLPLTLWYAARHGLSANLAPLVRMAQEQGVPTHGHARSQVACAFHCVWAWRLLEGMAPEGGWSAAAETLAALYEHGPVASRQHAQELQLILAWGDTHAPSGSGYVVDTLWTARATLAEATSFAGVVRSAIAYGRDTDTTACVAGGLAGIVFGAGGLEADWVPALRGRELLDPLLERLLALASTFNAGPSPVAAWSVVDASDGDANRFPLTTLAFPLAVRWHGAQLRKGTGIPYLTHLMDVASLVLQYGGNDVQAAAALLHDAIEDADSRGEAERRRRIIRETLGEPVLRIVEACSDATPDERGEKAPWAQRKLAYLEHLAHAPREALLVSCCDKLHNARAIVGDLERVGPAVWKRFSAEPPQLLWYYAGLASRFATLGVAASEGLVAAVERMRALSGTELSEPRM